MINEDNRNHIKNTYPNIINSEKYRRTALVATTSAAHIPTMWSFIRIARSASIVTIISTRIVIAKPEPNIICHYNLVEQRNEIILYKKCTYFHTEGTK